MKRQPPRIAFHPNLNIDFNVRGLPNKFKQNVKKCGREREHVQVAVHLQEYVDIQRENEHVHIHPYLHEHAHEHEHKHEHGHNNFRKRSSLHF